MSDDTSNRDQDRGRIGGADHDPGLAGSIGETAREAGETVKRHASGIAHSLMDEAGRQVEAQRGRVADRVSGVADIVQDAAQKIAEREPWLGRWVEQGAGGIHGFADTMRDRDPRDLLHGVTDFARRQPTLFAGAAVALGFALARATRSSIEGVSHGDHARGGGRSGRGYEDRGDRHRDARGGHYERAPWQDREWQDREWQGPSPAHAHDDDSRYGFAAHGGHAGDGPSSEPRGEGATTTGGARR